MSHLSSQAVIEWLVAWGDGNWAAADNLFPLIADGLHHTAHHYTRREPPGHALQPIIRTANAAAERGTTADRCNKQPSKGRR